MSNLKEIVLEEALDAEAKENGFDNWERASESWNKSKPGFGFVRKFTAYSEALDRLDAFYLWASVNGWTIFPDGNWHETDHAAFGLSDEELYQIFKQQHETP